MVTQLTIERLEAERVKDACGVTIEAERKNRKPLEAVLVDQWLHEEAGSWSFGTCKICRRQFDANRCNVHDFDISSGVCDAPECRKHVTEYNESLLYNPNGGRTPVYDMDCPIAYKEIIQSGALPPTVDRQAFNKVMRWSPEEKRGLILLGASGAGKTLAMWCKARDLETNATRVLFVTNGEWMRMLSRGARDLEKAERLLRAPVLFVDEVVKERVTPGAANAMFEVIDSRNNNRLPTVYASRFRGESFVSRFSDKIVGEDIRGRMSDCSARIEFIGGITNPAPETHA